MSVEDLLSQIEDLLDDGKPSLMGSGKVKVDSDSIRRILEDIRLEMPEEVKQARKIAAERKMILDKAQSKAAAQIKQGEMLAAQMVEETSIVKMAHDHSAQLKATAEAEAAQIVADARSQAADIIEKAKENYSEIVNNAQKWSSDLRNGASNFVDSIIGDTEGILVEGINNFNTSLNKIHIVQQQLENVAAKRVADEF
ncbi:MAG: hypothetical protein IKJ63_04765 [Clostridia bacterium]|nr:hypothetical protein [Clostridia bacterium]MBR2414595.1 hypothetical protein [Clostridia bacterium]MBR3954764.1 hypothetical protein [Clostridia bacterium]